MLNSKLDIKNIAWLAGLIEGEGCFYLRPSGENAGYPSISISMTDEDVIKRVAVLFKQTYFSQDKSKINGKRVYTVQINGSTAIAWMMTLYSFLGIRRQTKVKECIAAWKLSGRSKTHCRNGHEYTKSNTRYNHRDGKGAA